MTRLQEAIQILVRPLEAKHAVVSPGSRNAPIVQSLLAEGYTLHSAIDERSAGFQALGMAKSMRQAVVLSCTSGTAALNYYPAIAEAFYARIPLIVLTADRPPESIDQWDGQAIRQQDVFLSHCRLSLQTPDTFDDFEGFQKIAREINAYLEDGLRGPVHLNIPIREPFYNPIQFNEHTPPRNYIHNESILLLDADDYLPVGLNAKSVLVFNGMEDGQLMLVQCKDGASYENMVVLSDLTANQASTVPHWDALLYTLMRNNPEQADLLKPDVLITTGTTTVSKGLKQFLRTHKPKHHFHISRHDEIGDPFQTDPVLLNPYEPVRSHTAMIQLDDSYANKWAFMSAKFIDKMLSLDWSSFTEFSAMKQVMSMLPSGSIVHLANSMPVRLASFLVDEMDSMEVYSNRGTSGIDGSTSTALGNALVSSQTVYLITGDLAFLYDINAFLRSKLPSNLKVIVINNFGGRIFEQIDGPEKQPETLVYQTTSHSHSMNLLCQHFGLEYFCAENAAEVEQGMQLLKQNDSLSVMEIKTDPEKNKQLYQQFKMIQYE